MLSEDRNKYYSEWLDKVEDSELLLELRAMDEVQIEDAFYRDLKFGTGGLRGIIGCGTNRMNIYTVAAASQGLADYLNREPGNHIVAIGYDSRNKSDLFSKVTAKVLAVNGIRVIRFQRLMPVPFLSYVVRQCHCDAGVMITASHNPKEYNGYKVYGGDGCQITVDVAAEILGAIRKVDTFSDDIRTIIRDGDAEDNNIQGFPEELYDSYRGVIRDQSVAFGDAIDRGVSIVYTPLNGAGYEPVMDTLHEGGFNMVTVVEEQRDPDGNFPTCPYPNPEIREAMEPGLSYCRKIGADLLIATDPDCDRCGIAIREGDDYRLLSTNETGILLLDYICSQRLKHGRMPSHPVFMKTIVTSDLAETVARHYGVDTINVLTGFKYIGEMIGTLDSLGKAEDYIFGFEESCGYLTGTYARDKDGVNAAFMISEMYAYYKTRGINLDEKLKEIYARFGFCLNTQHSWSFMGSTGARRMEGIMSSLRRGKEYVGGRRITGMLDYREGIDGLPPADIVKYIFDNGYIVIRPSGTEPKLKAYISITAENQALAGAIEKEIAEDIGRAMV